MRRFEEFINDLFGGPLERRKGKNPGWGRGKRSKKLTHREMKLVPVEKGDKVLGGRKSTRARQNKWVPK